MEAELHTFPLSHNAPGSRGKTPVVPQNGGLRPGLEPGTWGNGGNRRRVLLSTWGSRGDVEPMLGLAVQLRAFGAAVRMCAPPDFAEQAARVGVPMVPVGQSARAGAQGEAVGGGRAAGRGRVGAPQVGVPQIADQPYWAGRVAELGIGTAHDGPTPTASPCQPP